MATAKSKTMHADGPKFPATLERDYPVVAANLKTANLFLLQQVGAAMDLIVGELVLQLERSLCLCADVTAP